jgi:hypothetical protein
MHFVGKAIFLQDFLTYLNSCSLSSSESDDDDREAYSQHRDEEQKKVKALCN